jgi:hypothetical protein
MSRWSGARPGCAGRPGPTRRRSGNGSPKDGVGGGLGGLLVLAGLVGGMWLRGAAERQARSQHPQAVANQREQPPLTPARR